jgi:hypothetical protein
MTEREREREREKERESEGERVSERERERERRWWQKTSGQSRAKKRRKSVSHARAQKHRPAIDPLRCFSGLPDILTAALFSKSERKVQKNKKYFFSFGMQLGCSYSRVSLIKRQWNECDYIKYQIINIDYQNQFLTIVLCQFCRYFFSLLVFQNKLHCVESSFLCRVANRTSLEPLIKQLESLFFF